MHILPHKIRALATADIDIRLICRDIGLYGENVGHTRSNVGLFGHVSQVATRNRDTFVYIYGSFEETWVSSDAIWGSFAEIKGFYVKTSCSSDTM